MNNLDIAANRGTAKWSGRVQVARMLWNVISPLFRLSPRPLWAWRRMLLRAFGAEVGSEVHVYPTVRITMPWNIRIGDQAAIGDRAILYALGPIEIGPRATISQGAHLCAGTHDITLLDRPLVKSPITIGAEAWIAADAFIGPGVKVGERAIVGARSVAMKDIAPGWIAVGNPAHPIRKHNP
jgi:putative colanic acid biosynthesis acetyltransferase WcaF